MASVERLVETRDLKTSRLLSMLDREQLTFLRYNSKSDMLLLMIVPPNVETVVHYIDDHLALLYEPDNLEVVGFQVEAFQHSFVAQHASLNRAWRLSDSGAQLEDLEDLILVFERKKRDMAQELKHIFLGQQNTSYQPTPA